MSARAHELLSVYHPGTVQQYRAVVRLADDRERGVATTEDLRQTMIRYRALFEDVLELGAPRDHRRRRYVMVPCAALRSRPGAGKAGRARPRLPAPSPRRSEARTALAVG